ncbi:hypothetical protein GCK32_009736 [Trichostrongylus colubriformis]|uniref:Drebrin-like protein n=1 Tax=Trichostrongylus colubriformis TaxID=6319 RepID=A0AAN8FX18_TRICO
MTLNFQKHGAALQSAYDRVVSSKSNEEWVIFDYEGTSNVLKIGDEGEYGLEEFATSFNSGRLQYGVIGVRLSKNAMTKIVLVHWQGEGVPSARVASTTSHIDAVRRFLKMVHVTIYARNEIDVEPDVIRREVAKLPATASSIGQYQGDNDVERHTQPQRRVVNSPNKLNSNRMEMFEKKEQSAPVPINAFHHDKKVQSPLPAISSTFSSSVAASSLHNSTSSSFSAAPSPNDSGYEAGASDSPRESDTAPRTYVSTQSSSGSITSSKSVSKQPSPAAHQSAAKVPQYEEPPCEQGLRAIALWDYQAADSTEISFDPDDIITEIDQVDPGWWRGRGPNGHIGLFPANYVSLL